MQVDFWGSTQEVNISLSQIGIWTMSTLMNEICSHFLTATRPSKITSLMKDWRDEIVLFAHWQVNMLSHLNAMGAIAADCVIATMRRPLDTPAFRYRVPFCQDRDMTICHFFFFFLICDHCAVAVDTNRWTSIQFHQVWGVWCTISKRSILKWWRVCVFAACMCEWMKRHVWIVFICTRVHSQCKVCVPKQVQVCVGDDALECVSVCLRAKHVCWNLMWIDFTSLMDLHRGECLLRCRVGDEMYY